jgi:hypothetical protein
MNSTSLRFLGLFLCTIFFASLSLAACPDSVHQTSLAGYALSPDATRIAAIADDGTLFWWDVAGGKRTQLLECAKPGFLDHPILFSPDSARVAVLVNSAVHVFEVPSGRLIARLTSLKLKNLQNVVFSGDGLRLAASHDEGAIVWDVRTGAEIMSTAGSISRKALALNRNGSSLALGRDGIELWDVATGKIVKKIPPEERLLAESLVFAHDDRWIVAAIATALPIKDPKQVIIESSRNFVILDVASGATVKSLSGLTSEPRFAPTLVPPSTLLAVGYDDYLRSWDLDSGELTKTWETPSGHPSANGKFLLREGSAPGRLELWEIGSPEETARGFTYRSPLCAESFANGSSDKKAKFDVLLMFNGQNQDGGWTSGSTYVAQDCSPAESFRSEFKSPERAKQELELRASQAVEIIEKGPPKDFWQQVFFGERVVARFVRRAPSRGVFAVMWVEGNYFREISSSSLPVVLEMERQLLQSYKKSSH